MFSKPILILLESRGFLPVVSGLLRLFVMLAVFAWIYAIVAMARSDFRKQNGEMAWMMDVIFPNFAEALRLLALRQKAQGRHANLTCLE